MKLYSPRCSNCVYFQKHNIKGGTKTCESAGKLGSDEACPLFMIDYRNIHITSSARHRNLFKQVHKAKGIDLKTLSFIAQQELVTRRNGFSLGQIGYVKVFRPNYQSSYFKVVVLAANDTYVSVESSFKGHTWYGEFLHASVLTEQQWLALKDTLPKKDPDFDKYFKYVKVSNSNLNVLKRKGRKKKDQQPTQQEILDKIADDLLSTADTSNISGVGSKDEIDKDIDVRIEEMTKTLSTDDFDDELDANYEDY